MQVPAAGRGDGLPELALPKVGCRGRGAQQRGLEAGHAAAPVACGALERPQLRSVCDRQACLPSLPAAPGCFMQCAASPLLHASPAHEAA